jgi:hypothetical protein
MSVTVFRLAQLIMRDAAHVREALIHLPHRYALNILRP